MKKTLLINLLMLVTMAWAQTKDNLAEIKNKDNTNNKDTLIKEILKSQLEDGESSSLGEEFESHKFSEKIYKQ